MFFGFVLFFGVFADKKNIFFSRNFIPTSCNIIMQASPRYDNDDSGKEGNIDHATLVRCILFYIADLAEFFITQC